MARGGACCSWAFASEYEEQEGLLLAHEHRQRGLPGPCYPFRVLTLLHGFTLLSSKEAKDRSLPEVRLQVKPSLGWIFHR